MSQTSRTKTESPKGRARKERILEIATRFIARNGSRGTTLAQIAEEAGVSQAGLLYHFPTKEALLHAVLDRRDEADEHLRWEDDEEPGIDVVNVIARAIRGWSGKVEVAGMSSILIAENAGQDSPLHPRLLNRYNATISHLSSALTIGQQRGEIRSDIDPRLKAIEMIAFINGLETAWLVNRSIAVESVAAQWAIDQVRALRPAGGG